MSFAGNHSLYHVECDLGDVACAHLGTIGALARACVNVRRRGEYLYVVNASQELQELIAFAGLDEVLLGRYRRQAEEREEPLSVEERGEADDLTV